ncbi:TorF family putative porin [Hirschia baltica]|uniref:Porin domain-containing protein n=1 Tax=Hirschia baltica (strain ATCC 49814 / DSM 5838 / IFAM 1418) TaxID=582402 RepID=C6XNT4_HIRBI|nr:TorF family putative porin [Hirschia baltica]ACT58337.1 conserved hypothetical protein [Hirschia baltica ATCC 49814]
MRNLFSASVIALAAIATTATATAEVELSGNVALTTDYHWRGVSQSNQDLALQGGFDLATDAGFYAGTWASTIDFLDDTDSNLEVDFYAGYGGEFGEGFGFDVGAIYYAYPDSDDGDLDFYEVYAGLSKSMGVADISGMLSYDPDNETLYANADLGVAFSDSFGASVGVGSYLDGFDEYTNYNIGGTYSVSGFDLDLRWYDNDADGAEDNIVFTIGRSL